MATLSQSLVTNEIQVQTESLDLQPCKAIVLHAHGQRLRVLSGAVWLSLCGEDYILKADDEILLKCGGDNQFVLSSLANKTAVVCFYDN